MSRTVCPFVLLSALLLITALLTASPVEAEQYETNITRQTWQITGSPDGSTTQAFLAQPFTFRGPTAAFSGTFEVVPVTFPDARIEGNFLVFDAPLTVIRRVTVDLRLDNASSGGNYSSAFTQFFKDSFSADSCSAMVSNGSHQPETLIRLTHTATCSFTRLTAQKDGNGYSGFVSTSIDLAVSTPGRISGMTFNATTYWRAEKAPDLRIDLIDPDCRSAVDVKCDEIVESTVVRSDATRRGIVADGTSALLLRASAPADAVSPTDTVTFTLEKNGVLADRKWGGLSTDRFIRSEYDTLTAKFDSEHDGRRFALVHYVAPDDHPDVASRSGNSIEATVTLRARTNVKPDEVVSRSIAIAMPPIVLVHGVWSDRSAWAGLETHLVREGFAVCPDCRPDYGSAEPAGSFDPRDPGSRFVLGTVEQAVQGALQDARRRGLAATRVDGVGHSMGGIVLRALVHRPNYSTRENHFKGSLHKVITVGSPHQGSPLVDWLLQHKCDEFSALARVLGGTAATIEQEFLNQGKPFGPAIYGFQTRSRALANIDDYTTRTDLRGYAIIGIAPTTSATEHVLNKVPEFTGNRNAGGQPLTIDEILGGDLTHDTIVPAISQRGDNPAHTTFDFLVHADTSASKVDVGETESELDVWEEVVRLLKAPTSTFGTFARHVSDRDLPIPDVPCPSSATLVSSAMPSALGSHAVAITPTAGTVVRGGETVVLSMTLSGGAPVEGVLFTAGGQAAVVEGAGPSFTTSWVVPRYRAGRIELVARTFGPGENYAAESHVIVEPEQPPVSIRILPAQLSLPGPKATSSLRVIGTLPDGSEVDLTAVATVTIATNGAGVARIAREGVIEATSKGTTSVSATWRTLSATGELIVETSGKMRAVRH